MKLSEFELDVLQLFWDNGSLSSPRAHSLIGQQKDVTYSTVKTIIDRLEEKGAIRRDSMQGRTIYYTHKVSKGEVTKKLLPNFLRRFFEGDSRLLISHLMTDEKLKPEDLDYLQKLIEERQKGA